MVRKQMGGFTAEIGVQAGIASNEVIIAWVSGEEWRAINVDPKDPVGTKVHAMRVTMGTAKRLHEQLGKIICEAELEGSAGAGIESIDRKATLAGRKDQS